jgi:hypothetical protein
MTMSRTKRPAAKRVLLVPRLCLGTPCLGGSASRGKPCLTRQNLWPRQSLGTRCELAGLDCLASFACLHDPPLTPQMVPARAFHCQKIPDKFYRLAQNGPVRASRRVLPHRASRGTACLSVRENFSEIAVAAEFLPPPASAADITVTPRLCARRGTRALGQSSPEIERGEGKGSLCDSEAPHAGSYACCR